MRKIFDEDDDDGYSDLDKKKILVTIIPFVLIIIILAVTLAVGGMKKEKNDLEQTSMEKQNHPAGRRNKVRRTRQRKHHLPFPRMILIR